MASAIRPWITILIDKFLGHALRPWAATLVPVTERRRRIAVCRALRHRQVRTSACLTLLAVLPGCTSPLWWHDPQRGFIYRGWSVNIADQATVQQSCALSYPVMGCVVPATMTAFSVNNPYVLWHECHHIDAIMDGGSYAVERAKDTLASALGINFLLATLTGPFPAPGDCGQGTMARWHQDRIEIVESAYGRSHVLPTIEQWNRDNPERAMQR